MSGVLPAQKILTTSTNFYTIPRVQTWDVPDVIPAAHSGDAPSVSSTASTTYHNIDQEEPCFVTKSFCYTHKRAHWVNAVRGDPDVKGEVEDLLRKRAIVYPNFVLDSVVNLSNFDCVLHAALDKYAFFAVTGSFDTLRELISMLKKDNDRRQAHFDAKGLDSGRILDFEAPVFVNPQYELVALRPKHLLPNGKVLVTYSRDADGLVLLKTYVPGEDHTLRESPGNLSCPRFPPFSFDYHRRNYANLNPFLVILNAEMPNTPAAQIFLNTSPILAPEPQPSDAEMGYIDGGEEEGEVPTHERMDYGQYLLSGQDPVFDDDENLVEQLSQNYQGTPSHRIKEVWAWRNTVEV
ncbi:hypothetical protein B0H34DRAFT_861504 [Crassisporium funariophilum]|nr:hypothetical protein B0H34DRAFT_861504 [Crassisporium funariophilum]